MRIMGRIPAGAPEADPPEADPTFTPPDELTSPAWLTENTVLFGPTDGEVGVGA